MIPELALYELPPGFCAHSRTCTATFLLTSSEAAERPANPDPITITRVALVVAPIWNARRLLTFLFGFPTSLISSERDTGIAAFSCPDYAKYAQVKIQKPFASFMLEYVLALDIMQTTCVTHVLCHPLTDPRQPWLPRPHDNIDNNKFLEGQRNRK